MQALFGRLQPQGLAPVGALKCKTRRVDTLGQADTPPTHLLLPGLNHMPMFPTCVEHRGVKQRCLTLKQAKGLPRLSRFKGTSCKRAAGS